MIDFSNVKYFIYCSGKSGSTTLVKQFTKKFGTEQVLKTHSPSFFTKSYPENGDIKNLLFENSKVHDKIYIIDSYREPFERAIASFFQSIDRKIPKWQNWKLNKIINIFNQEKYYLLDSYHSYHYFFDYFNISKSINFNFEKGYTLIEHDNFILIKTRLKDSFRWNEIFSEIFNTEFSFSNFNSSESKPYFELYESFKKQYELPQELKNEFKLAFQSPIELLDTTNPLHLNIVEMKKFMSKDELKDYLTKWDLN